MSVTLFANQICQRPFFLELFMAVLDSKQRENLKVSNFYDMHRSKIGFFGVFSNSEIWGKPPTVVV
jgi:hypothetical protein